MRIGFSIMPPWEVTQATHTFISGRARVVRVEEVSEDSVDRVGIGRITHLKTLLADLTIGKPGAVIANLTAIRLPLSSRGAILQE